MELTVLPARPAEWDKEIAAFATKSLFHESAWIDFVLACYPGSRADYFRITNGPELVGYFCAFRRSRGGFRLYECPLTGRGVHLSAVVNSDIDTTELVRAIVDQCRARRIAFLELHGAPLVPQAMQDLGFEVEAGDSHVCPLDGGTEAVWNRMHSTCRNRIRKGEKSGLVAEATNDPALVEQFYNLFSKVLALRGKQPPYPLDTLRRLLEHLGPAGRVFSVRVKQEGEVIGAAFYPHDDRAMYYWDGASDPEKLDLAPNELLHWTAIKLAIERGIPLFNIGGAPVPSRFTTKFGGELQPFVVYRKSLMPWFTQARRIYNWFRG